ncbi:MAG TPA: class II aldolase/adducin family protein [Candidatus Limnocylindrales bacterium]|nr:class II aldolase/adducin family protein [Candidatus Limnocylindrales bacterium]
MLEEVARLSRRFGSDPEYTRGGGGNSSAKVDGVLYIKASGRSLATLSGEELMPLRMAPLLATLDGGAGASTTQGTDEIMRTALAARINPDDDRRPSVEFLFHALLPDPIVLHTHPTVVNALTCARGGQRIAADIFGDDALWVPYIDPGLPLARRIDVERRTFERRTGRPAPRGMLLQNHGMIVTGDKPAEVAARSERIVDAIRRRLEPPGSAPVVPETNYRAAAPATIAALTATLRRLLAEEDRPTIVLFDDTPSALEIACMAAGRKLVHGGPLTPDQIVYTGSWPLWIERTELDDAESIQRTVGGRLVAHVAKTGVTPSVVVVAGLGVFIVADSERFAATAAEVLFDAMRVAQGAATLGGVRVLARNERRFIEDWEAEAYRRGVETVAPVIVRTM